MKFFTKTAHIWIPLIILAGALTLRIVDPLPLQKLRWAAQDIIHTIHPREYDLKPAIEKLEGLSDIQVRIVDLDDESLNKVGQWPWPRNDVAQLVANLVNNQALVVGLDIFFTEEDGKSPAAILSRMPEDTEIAEIQALRDKSEILPDYDEIFAEILSNPAVNVVTAFASSAREKERLPVKKAGIAHGGDDPRLFIRTYAGTEHNIDLIENASKGNGSVIVDADDDGVIRRVPMLVGVVDPNSDAEEIYERAEIFPALSMEVLRVLQGAIFGKDNISYIIKSSGASGEQSFGEQTGISQIRVGKITVPTDGSGQILVRYTPPNPDRYVPAWQVMDGSVDPGLIAGHIVLVGTSAQGLQDIRNTPLNPAVAGVEVHAQVLEQMLTSTYLLHPDYAIGVEVVFILVIGLALILLLPLTGALWSAVMVIASVAGAFGASYYAYTQLNTLYDPIYPVLTVIVIFIASNFILYMRTEAEKREVRGAFSMYLSPDLVEQLADHPEQLTLGGAMRDMTILFCDVRGFTTISEQFDAVGLTAFINRFLTPMTEVIMSRRGTIDKYMGDCIMAFWNAPLDDEEHAKNACRSAMAMLKCRDELNADLKREAEEEERKFIPVNIGIGLNSGNICVGNMGSAQRFDYSVLGDDVNLASRLEGQSKTYGVDIVIGENTAHQVDGFAVLELDLIQVKGKTVPVRIFGLMGDDEDARTEDFQKLKVAHDACLEAYRAQQWQKCLQLATMCRQLAKDRFIQGYYDLIEERVDIFRDDPPGADWDGVFIATSK